MAELGVVVVLDDQVVTALGPVDQLSSPSRAEHYPSGELVRRGDYDDLRLTGVEVLDGDPLPVDGDGRYLQPGLLDDQSLRVPAWILECHPLDPGPPQPPRGERQALPEPC